MKTTIATSVYQRENCPTDVVSHASVIAYCDSNVIFKIPTQYVQFGSPWECTEGLVKPWAAFRSNYMNFLTVCFHTPFGTSLHNFVRKRYTISDQKAKIYTIFQAKATQKPSTLRVSHMFRQLIIGSTSRSIPLGRLKVTVQFERCFRLMEHISVIS